MNISIKRSASIYASFIIFVLVLTGTSHARIDRGTIELLLLFDDGVGNAARDSSGNGRDGELTGGKWVDGKFGKALEFDGAGDQVVIGDYFGIGGADPRTTVLWFNSDQIITHSWVKWGVATDTHKYYVRGHDGGGEIWLRVETEGGQHYGGTNVCDGEWHHLAVVFPDGSDSVKDHLLYVDGVLETTTGGNDVGVDTDNSVTEVHIGAPLAHHVYANGIMDEIAIFNVALDEDDINTIMKQGLASALAVGYKDKLATTWSTVKTLD